MGKHYYIIHLTRGTRGNEVQFGGACWEIEAGGSWAPGQPGYILRLSQMRGRKWERENMNMNKYISRRQWMKNCKYFKEKQSQSSCAKTNF